MTLRIAALLTTHNRVATTMACLRALEAQEDADVKLTIVVCDAGSTDGTPEQLRLNFASAEVLQAGPELYWNGGMRLAFAYAVQQDYDFYLWLNDDTVLDPRALHDLLAAYRDPRVRTKYPAIIAGATRDPKNGALTYGGVIRPNPRRRLHFETTGPQSQPQEVETMHGNCVLIPREVVRRIGLLDRGFSHSMGDFDYGLRARADGVSIWVAPHTLAVCARNAPAPPAASFHEYLIGLLGPKGLPPREWGRFCRRWAGRAWPLYAVGPYVRRTMDWVRTTSWQK